MPVKYQTIAEFLRSPFGTISRNDKLTKYNSLYMSNTSKIILNAYTKIEESYYFHVKIPSESQKDGNVYYDVVIRFFTDKPDVQKSTNLRDYYIQFFSNSPGFIYNYAVLYKNKGYLIESLYTKLDPRYFDKLPVKTNSKLELSYDKSIYFACRFLNEHKLKVLNKVGVSLGKRMQPDAFFKEIKDFQSVKIENALLTLERQSLKNFAKSLDKRTESSDNDNGKQTGITKKTATMSTTKDKRNPVITKKTAGLSTSGIVKTIIKKTSSKSTRKH